MKKFQKYLIGLGVTCLIFGILGHVSAASEMQVIGDKIETQLAECQTIYHQFGEIESTVQQNEVELVALEEAYNEANELVDQLADLQIALSEAESFHVESHVSDEVNQLKDAEYELKSLETIQSEVFSRYETAKTEKEIERARVEAEAETEAKAEATRIENERTRVAEESARVETDTPDEMTVYWTVNGEVWHRSRNCRGLNAAKEANIRSGTIAQSGKARECKHSANGG